MARHRVYNLEFPSYCERLTICGFSFSRVEDYMVRVQEMHQPINTHSEFPRERNFGGHSHTAFADFPDEPLDSKFFPHDEKKTSLDDVLLLISLFTTRNVFHYPDDLDQSLVDFHHIDHRCFPWGGGLETSIPYTPKNIRAAGWPDEDCEYDAGLEVHLPVIYDRIRSED